MAVFSADKKNSHSDSAICGYVEFINSSFVSEGLSWNAGTLGMLIHITHMFPRENINNKSDLDLLIIYRFAVHQR